MRKHFIGRLGPYSIDEENIRVCHLSLISALLVYLIRRRTMQFNPADFKFIFNVKVNCQISNQLLLLGRVMLANLCQPCKIDQI